MQLQKSESQHTEFKKAWQDEYLKWICAFANTDGGVLYVGVDDLDRDSIRLFKRMALDHNRLDRESLEVPDEVLMRNLRLYENDYLTKAAVMCFHPDPEKFVTCAYIKIGFFADNDADILYQDEIRGSLIMQVEKTMDLIYTKYMKALISYDGIHRKETFFFPKEAFRELLLNAVIHRDYMKPTPIQIRVYAQNIRIWNFGKMPVDVPVENLYKPHSSEPRNPNIANVFFKAGYVESWGRGYHNISDICKFRNAKLPEPQENSGGLMVNCPASEKYISLAKELKVDGVNEKVNDGVYDNSEKSVTINPQSRGLIEKLIEKGQTEGIKLTENRIRILRLILANPYITKTEMADNIGISENAVSKNIEAMRGKLINRVGPDKGGLWEVLGQ